MSGEPATPADFDARYREDNDPWRVLSSAYERRKAGVVMASLPHDRYHSAWEPGCGVGALTRLLAQRCDHVVATEASAAAARLADQRCADLSRVRVHHSALPECPLTGAVELVVASELLYYLPDLPGSLDVLWGRLVPGGTFATVHWRHDGTDMTSSGEALHAVLSDDAEARGARRLVHHLDEHFVLDVYQSAR